MAKEFNFINFSVALKEYKFKQEGIRLKRISLDLMEEETGVYRITCMRAMQGKKLNLDNLTLLLSWMGGKFDDYVV